MEINDNQRLGADIYLVIQLTQFGVLNFKGDQSWRTDLELYQLSYIWVKLFYVSLVFKISAAFEQL